MSSTPSTALRIEALTTGYQRGRRTHVVTQGLNASLPQGSFTALIGTNGSGKSTLLRTLAALQPPIDGRIEWMGNDVNLYSPRERARCLSVVLTDRIDGAGLSVREVVEMGRMPYTGFHGRLNEADHNIVCQAMEDTAVGHLARRSIHSLSDGERQRVMVAKALAQQTPIILLDEPSAFLDYPGKLALLQLLQQLSEKQGKTILLSTHDLDQALRMVSHLWLLNGNQLHEGSPQEFAENGMLEKIFAVPPHHLRT